jgi:1-acyl-sn-glycerol-3-phosphate acyltransferase
VLLLLLALALLVVLPLLRRPSYEVRRRALPAARVPGRAGRSLYAALVRVVALLLRAVGPLRVTGADLPGGVVLVVANHRSLLDGPLLAVVGHRRGRQLRLLGTAGVFTTPVVGRLLLAAGLVPVARRTPQAREALDGAAALLRAGEAVALFPEGGVRTAADGLPEQLRSGAARLALATGAPVVAVGLAGTDRAAPVGTRRLRRGRLVASVSPPLDLLAALGVEVPQPDPAPALVEAATALVAAHLAAAVRQAVDAGDLRPVSAPARVGPHET